jgi:signal transduction histidine kinase
VISISTREINNFVEIQNTETRAGESEDIHERIFDPFFTAKGVGMGAGQGPVIAYNVIVEKHDGTISFETETGVGTTFIIRLPIETNASERKSP